ncbi:hypothetical protein [Hyphomicrobium sp. DY-1]|uniref:hypothetical protein n=1 Tax=Hyphomicrobium sp. DY-1 TaxID=3075650 RepID=UPI0039C25524
MKKVQLLLAVIVFLLAYQIVFPKGNPLTVSNAEPSNYAPWVGYAFSKEKHRYERWYSRFDSYFECRDLMGKEIGHKLPPGHWLNGGNLGDWYSGPVGCIYEGSNSMLNWWINKALSNPDYLWL